MKPVIIFHQRKAPHSRIGNTLMWVFNAMHWCEKHGYEFYFPKADNILNSLFDTNSSVFNVPEKIKNSFFYGAPEIIDPLLDHICDSCYSVTNIKENEKQFLSVFNSSLAVINGKNKVNCDKINWDDDKVHCLIKEHTFTIIDQPYNLSVNKRVPMEGALHKKALHYVKNTINPMLTVHIRQGDYIHWREGRYYNDDRYYNELLRKLIHEFGSQKIAYVSNGKFQLDEDLKDNLIVQPIEEGLSEFLTDFLYLAKSKFIVGPPSTFSGQAISISLLSGNIKPKFFAIERESNIDELIININNSHF